MNFWDTAVYQPLYNILILLYQYLPGRDFGVAVIVLAALIKLVLHPLLVDSTRTQKIMAQIQPRLAEIQGEYKGDKEKQAQLTMKLYRDNKINLFSGVLLFIVQIAIIIPLYRIFRQGFGADKMAVLYGFVHNPGAVNPAFLGAINLAHAYPLFAVVAGALQFAQMKLMMPKPPAAPAGGQAAQMSQTMQTQMMYLFPLMTAAFLWGWPAVIGLYRIAISVISIIEQHFVLKKIDVKLAA